jgi:hypothetical protein
MAENGLYVDFYPLSSFSPLGEREERPLWIRVEGQQVRVPVAQ